MQQALVVMYYTVYEQRGGFPGGSDGKQFAPSARSWF